MAVETGKTFAFVIYPESNPDWLEKLRALNTPAFAILHDRDVASVDEETGEITFKKEHVHIMLMLESTRSINQIKEDLATFDVDYVKKIGSRKGYAQYLIHANDRDKAQYNPDDVLSLCGADYKKYIAKIDTTDALSEILSWCEETGTTSFYLLTEYIRREKPEFLPCLASKAYFIHTVLKSRSWTLARAMEE